MRSGVLLPGIAHAQDHDLLLALANAIHHAIGATPVRDDEQTGTDGEIIRRATPGMIYEVVDLGANGRQRVVRVLGIDKVDSTLQKVPEVPEDVQPPVGEGCDVFHRR